MKMPAMVVLAGAAGLLMVAPRPTPAAPASPQRTGPRVTQGALIIRDTQQPWQLECPLKHTDVKAEISGFISRVTVTQDFENTAKDKVEAVYVFPLPHNAAIDAMTLQIGDRVIKGQIKRKQEAQAIYQAARNAGNVAALLDQERPNIFTQSVANIAPGAKVRVVISYSERLEYEAGTYQFTFPMVVGPRYHPRNVTDAARITPPVARPDQRAGHDISVEVKLDAGVALDSVDSPSHPVQSDRPSPARAVVRLRDQDTIPNKDFILRYDVAGRKIGNAVLTHRDQRGGFFSLILQPPERVTPTEITPKEIVFVLDTSGSMNGFPLEKAKESMRMALAGMHPRDTFNLITFSGDTQILFPAPVPATRENLARAEQFLASQTGHGGTEMMKAIRAALEPSDSQEHLRIACFMTDGFVGNEAEIIAEIQRHPNARVFSFGIGNSINRYLLDKMAEAGRGEVEYVSLEAHGSAAAKRFHERVNSPLLTDIRIDWNGLPVEELFPARIADLFAAKPVVVTGKYSRAAKGVIRLQGRMAGKAYSAEIPVELPGANSANEALASLWARTKIDSLMLDAGPDAVEQITKLGLDYRLMTQYTSFVAVEETTVIEGGKPRRVEVPVELPEGVSYQGVFGESPRAMVMASIAQAMTFLQSQGAVGGVIGGVPSASDAMVAPRQMAPPPPPAAAPSYAKMEQAKLKVDPALKGLTGKLRVSLAMADTSDATLALLKQAGVEVVERRRAGILIVRIDASKLPALAQLDAVLWIGKIE
ncbi:MAG: VIT domain-containing protein [Bryobacteraceae bacterium]|nr:VIT domain-containing protein [Bryobacteraceae bacterium]